MEFKHIPVMLDECIEGLNIKADGVYVDCTIGGGGHSEEILKRIPNGLLIGIDKDSEALRHCEERLDAFGNKRLVKSDYCDLDEVLKSLGIDKVDGVLMDLGVSSYQLDNAERGFSYIADAPLDMRMNCDQQLTAADVVNDYSQEELKRILRDYGEEKFAANIAKNIVSEREKGKILTTGELVGIIEKSIPAACKRTGGHPAKKTFQAIRIEVNGELSRLGDSVTKGVRALKAGGRIAVITFHSLEDRIVKQTMKELETDCTCPKDFPICVCGKKSEIKILTNKPLTATEEELRSNPRSASAKLRIAERKPEPERK